MQGLRILTDEVSLKAFKRAKTPEVTVDHVEVDSDSDSDSLFDSNSLFDDDESMLGSPDDFIQTAMAMPLTYSEPAPPPTHFIPAKRTGPQIPGLFFDPFVLLPDELAEGLLQKCIEVYFQHEDANQVMLFERVTQDEGGRATVSGSGLPTFLKDLLATLSQTLVPLLPLHTHELLFPPANAPPRARQVIINFYRPGEGITPHVDLLDRFGDGIIGVSLGSGCVMRFVKVEAGSSESEDEKAKEQSPSDVFLPHGSIYVMSEEARYGWTHGIDRRKEDWVQESVNSEAGRWVMRSIRVSITFRWLLPGADIVGGLAEPTSQY